MYENWVETISHTKLHWYSVSNLVKYLHELREIIILDQTSKTYQSKITVLNNIEPPFSKDKRFPGDDAYICEGIGNLTEKLDKLNLAVNVILNPQRLQRHYKEYNTIGEVEIHILKTINQFLCELDQNTDTVITQELFESRNRLLWNGDEHSLSDNNATKSAISSAYTNGEGSKHKNDDD